MSDFETGMRGILGLLFGVVGAVLLLVGLWAAAEKDYRLFFPYAGALAYYVGYLLWKSLPRG